MSKLLFIDVTRLKEIAKKAGSCGLRARHKLAVLERDGFKCINCGKGEGLTNAHIVPVNEQNRNASSYKIEECKTQCSDCHLAEEFGREYVR